jgi:hypothetical protein
LGEGIAILQVKAIGHQLEAEGEVLTVGRKGHRVVHPASMSLAVWVSITASGIPQRTSYADFEAAGVTAAFDGSVPGRMYSGPILRTSSVLPTTARSRRGTRRRKR